MRPHTAALSILLKNIKEEHNVTLSSEAKEWEDIPQSHAVYIRYRNSDGSLKSRDYDIKIQSVSRDTIKLRIDRDSWSCTSEITKSRDEYTIDHQHSNGNRFQERFKDYGKSLQGAYDKNKKSHSFKASLYGSEARQAQFSDSARNTYDVKIR